MKALALMFFLVLTGLWYFFSWKYLQLDMGNLVASGRLDMTHNNLVVLFLLAGMFVFGVLVGKLFCKKVVENTKSDYFSNESYSQKSKNNFITDIEEVDEFSENQDFEIEPENYFSQFNDVTKDDLQVIEGIGPKIEELLNSNGIHSYQDLINTDHKKISSILKSGGSRFALHNPKTWGKQAKLAYSGDIAELKEYQKQLNKGV